MGCRVWQWHLCAGLNSKVTVESNAGKSTMGTWKLAWRFSCFYYCLPFWTVPIDALMLVCFKCFCCFARQGTPSSFLNCLGVIPAWAVMASTQSLKRFNGLTCFLFPLKSSPWRSYFWIDLGPHGWWSYPVIFFYPGQSASFAYESTPTVSCTFYKESKFHILKEGLWEQLSGCCICTTHEFTVCLA